MKMIKTIVKESFVMIERKEKRGKNFLVSEMKAVEICLNPNSPKRGHNYLANAYRMSDWEKR